MAKRVHEIAKERGVTAKELLEQLRAAGVDVKAASSNVDEDVAARVLGNGAAAPPASPPAKKAPEAKQAVPPKAPANTASADKPAAAATPPAPPRAPSPSPAAAPAAAGGAEATPPADGPAEAARADHKRPTRDSLQGERAPGSAGGRRRVVIDSQASRRAAGGGAPPSSQPPRRQRRGRRRRGVYDEEAESRPSTPQAVIDSAIRINSGSTVKDIAEYLDVPVPEVMKKLMALGEMKTLTQTLSDESIEVLAAELGKEVEIVHSEDETVEPSSTTPRMSWSSARRS